MFIFCEAMGWNHLPMPGGLYDQHPGLLDRFMHIFQEKNAEEQRQEARREAERGKGHSRPTRRGASRAR